MSNPSADIRALYGRVTEHFSAGNVDALRACFHLPLLITSPDGVVLVADDNDFQTVFGGTIEQLRNNGFTRSAIERQQIRAFSPNTALTSVLWVRYRGEDILERLGATYTLTRSEGTWRITALLTHEPDAVLDLDGAT